MTDSIAPQAPAAPPQEETGGALDQRQQWDAMHGRGPNVDANGTLHMPGKPAATSIGGDVGLFEAKLAHEVMAGRMTQADMDKMMGRGAGPAAPAAAAAPSDDDVAVATHLTEIGFPPARPDELRLRPALAGPDDPAAGPELQKAESTITQWIVDDLKLPSGIANSIISETAKTAPAWEAMNDGERELQGAKCRAQLTAMWGDGADAKIKLAVELIKKVDAQRPGLVVFLNESGAGSNPFVVAQVALHAERIAARKE